MQPVGVGVCVCMCVCEYMCVRVPNLHVRGKQRPTLILAARDKHEHVITRPFQLSEVRIERNGRHWRFVPAELSVG